MAVGLLLAGLGIVPAPAIFANPPTPLRSPAALARTSAPTRPLPPPWVFEPWVWEDDENSQAATLELVTGYRFRDIPVGAVIIDSPWETYYNSFEFCDGTGGGSYNAPRALIDSCHAMGVRVIAWITGMVNAPGTDGDGCNLDPRPNFCNPENSQYFVNPDCSVRTHWWKNPAGVDGGKFVDFRKAEARAWWVENYVDRVLAMGVDGFKVDETDRYVDNVLADNDARRAYAGAYYTAMYEAVVARRGDDAMITARPFDKTNLGSWGGHYGGISAPIASNPAGWVGDQRKTWGNDGFLEALDNMFTSAELGYVACGSDIGGFQGSGPIPPNLFRRWSQFGALSPIMENGGNGEHRPWMYGGDMLETYRRFAKLHHFLAPHLYSCAIDFVSTGISIMRPCPGWDAPTNATGTKYTYTLGEDLFVAVLYEDTDTRRIAFPPGTWLDFFDDDEEYEGTRDGISTSPSEYPLYVKKGAFVPLSVDRDDLDPGFELGVGSRHSDGHLTILYYPSGTSSHTFNRTPASSLTFEGIEAPDSLSIIVGPSTERLIFRIKYRDPDAVFLNGAEIEELPSMAELEAANRGWFRAAENAWLWLKFEADGGQSSLCVRPTPTPVVLASVAVRSDAGGITIDWSTSFEATRLGFHVLRADARGRRRFRRLSREPIRAIGGTRRYTFADRSAEPGASYVYRLEALELDGGIHTYDLPPVTVAGAAPERPRLRQSFANPMRRSAALRFELPLAAPVTLQVYDVSGRLVRSLVDDELGPGEHTVIWSARDRRGQKLAGGEYFYRLTAGGTLIAARKLVILE